MNEISTDGDDLPSIKSKGRILSTAIDRYITESIKVIGRPKAQVLRSVRDFNIAETTCNEIQSRYIVDFTKDLVATRSPATVGNYMSHLRQFLLRPDQLGASHLTNRP